ncbi:hypothetical protein BT96DRAFT_323142 [Gymnopus androsaceus JB14]|uniref:Uncharacterized protein n=1 Tax=Gymnopus androsaceus JB14 TaxID=1447944 RepID=A0A6A4GZN3_9AGAR|nr:hypothetical protein BT96DRAFT_323142 [Gymnopus androsaceus JB14]
MCNLFFMPPQALRIQFPHEQWPGWHITELNLQSVSLQPSSGNPNLSKISQLAVGVDPETCTDYSSDSPVFRGTILKAESISVTNGHVGAPSFSPFYNSGTMPSLALKFALREDLVDDLAQEAEVYEGALRPVQGITVPRCYGFFTGVGSEGQQIACLALEFWGESLQQPFKMLSIDIRYAEGNTIFFSFSLLNRVTDNRVAAYFFFS